MHSPGMQFGLLKLVKDTPVVNREAARGQFSGTADTDYTTSYVAVQNAFMERTQNPCGFAVEFVGLICVCSVS